jgi:enoyl-CoA hydratase/carnithine racemase
MSDDLVLYQAADGIATVTLNNRKRRNALSTETMSMLLDFLVTIKDSREVRVVVLRAEGPVFSSGHDLKELRDGCEADYVRVFQTCIELMAAIRALPQPLIAMVDGLATAAGCQLVAASDLAVATEESSFAAPGVKIGVFCTTPGVAIARSVMPKKAMEMLLTGLPMSAEEAVQAGLINRAVPKGELEETTYALAGLIADASPVTLAIGKEAFYRQIDMECGAAYEYAAEIMVKNTLEPDAQEGINAFFDKRKPQWRDQR